MIDRLTDIGVNLLSRQFDEDREAVVERARAAGVTRMLITCTDLAESSLGQAFCRANPDGFWCTAGVHPHHAKDVGRDWLDQLTELAKDPSVKAVGETGLDFNRNFSPPEQQLAVFDAQLTLAADTGKPVFVHDRDSEGKVFELLNRHRGKLPGVVVHCFTGTRLDLQLYLKAGFYIGITGWVCDARRGQDLRDIVTMIPLDRLLIETDAPYLRPHNAPAPPPGLEHHKRRNEPALLGCVAAQLAQLYGVDHADVAQASWQNASRLFDLPDPA
ncbi:MAG: hydrolase TatD [Pseudomonadales bacterium]|nr:hydrolase TatD [Pseudomonadales bacterium]NIX09561.1 hydrolase TatD [Pseudomonadales bacterium]